MKKNCLYCNKEFEKDYHSSKKHFLTITKYCSLKCKREWMAVTFTGKNNPSYKGKITKACETCNKQFEVYPYRGETAKFCSVKCHGVTRVGEKGINWQGGKTSINAKIRESFEYEEWRKAVFERDNYTCVKCGEIGGKLEADHIKLFSRFPELRLDVSNGQTLCKGCHRVKTIQDLRENWKNQYKESSIEALN